MRAEIWQERYERMAPLIAAALPVADIAQQLGLAPATVRTYLKRFSDGAVVDGKIERRVRQFQSYAERGMTRSEAAREAGVTLGTVCRYAAEYQIGFVREGKGVRDKSRVEAMASMYRAGKTLQEIGILYDVSRERVRQLISREYGLDAHDGGCSARVEAKKRKALARKNEKCLAKYGCTYAQYRQLIDIGRAMRSNGIGFYRTPTGAWHSQRFNAKNRGIEWNLSLWDWWLIWQKSGRWEKRGRGQGYMMCRFGDTGPYEIGNVYIATGVHNGSIQPNNPYRSDHPDHQQVVRKLTDARKMRTAA